MATRFPAAVWRSRLPPSVNSIKPARRLQALTVFSLTFSQPPLPAFASRRLVQNTRGGAGAQEKSATTRAASGLCLNPGKLSREQRRVLTTEVHPRRMPRSTSFQSHARLRLNSPPSDTTSATPPTAYRRNRPRAPAQAHHLRPRDHPFQARWRACVKRRSERNSPLTPLARPFCIGFNPRPGW